MRSFASIAVFPLVVLFLSTGCGQNGDRVASDESSSVNHPPSAEAAALRYVREELGWERIRVFDLAYADTRRAEDVGPIRVRVIRCAKDDWDDTYPDISCDPSPDDRAYPAALVTVQGGTEKGRWSVTGLEETSIRQRVPASSSDVQDFVSGLLESRIEGSGAEEYLASGGTKLPHPVYSPGSSPAYDRFEVVFVDGPLWPFAWWEVGIRIFTQQGKAGEATSFAETLFVGPRDDMAAEKARLLVHGGRPGLTGP